MSHISMCSRSEDTVRYKAQPPSEITKLDCLCVCQFVLTYLTRMEKCQAGRFNLPSFKILTSSELQL